MAADHIKAIALILSAAAGFLTAASTALEASKKQADDYAVVEILARQLAAAQANCK